MDAYPLAAPATAPAPAGALVVPDGRVPTASDGAGRVCTAAPCAVGAGLLHPVDPQLLITVRRVLHTTAPLHVVLDLPTSARQQIGQAWRETLGPAGVRGSWGRHTVHVDRYTRTGPVCVAWGADQPMTWGFWRTYATAAYAVLPPPF